VRIANIAGRLALLDPAGQAIDAEQASSGWFGASAQAVYDRRDEFRAWAAATALPAGQPFDSAQLGSPAPTPRQARRQRDAGRPPGPACLGLGRHHAGSNFFWYLKDPAGNFSEYYSDMDCIVDDQLWTPEALEGARGLFSWDRRRRPLSCIPTTWPR
jgi:hypothetical protein